MPTEPTEQVGEAVEAVKEFLVEFGHELEAPYRYARAELLVRRIAPILRKQGADQERQRVEAVTRERDNARAILEFIDKGEEFNAGKRAGAEEALAGVGESVRLAEEKGRRETRQSERQRLKEALEKEVGELNRFAAMATVPAHEAAIWITAASRLQALLDTLETD